MPTVTADALATANSPTPGGGVSSLTFSLTVGAGADRCLIVDVVMAEQTATTVSSVTWGGDALVRVASVLDPAANKVRTERWLLMGPKSGTFNVVVSLSATTQVIACARSYTNVDQYSGFGPPIFSTSSAATVQGPATHAASTGDLMVDVLGIGGGAAPATGASQTADANVVVANGSSINVARLSTSFRPFASGFSVTSTWTFTTSAYSWIGGILRATVAGQTPFIGEKVIQSSPVSTALAIDQRRLTRFVLTKRGGIDSIYARLDGSGSGNADQVVRCNVYADNDGVPGNLLIESTEVTVKATQAADWVKLTLPRRIWLPIGSYWVGIHSGPTSNGARTINFSTAANASWATITDTYSDGASTDGQGAGQALSASLFHLYAEYVPDEGPTATLAHPTTAESVRGTIALGVEANSGGGIASVQFKVDGADYGTLVTAPPWSVELDTTALSNANHTYTAVVTNVFGDTVTPTAVTFAVNNVASPLASQGTKSALPPRPIVEIDFVTDPGQVQYATLVQAALPWAWYRMSEAAGAVAVDGSVNGRDATYVGTVTKLQTGPITGETADKAVSLAAAARVDATGVAGLSALTALFWFEAKATSGSFFGGTPYTLLSIGRASADEIAATYYTNSQNISVARAGQTPVNSIVASAWNMVAVVVGPMETWARTGHYKTGYSYTRSPAGTFTLRAIQVYVNGVLGFEAPYLAPTGGGTILSYDPLADIGTTWQLPSALTTTWAGKVDELAFFDSALDAGTIAKIYGARTITPPPAPTWSDVTADVLAMGWQTGKQGNLDRSDVGKGSLVLQDPDGRYEPENAAGAHYPNVLPMRRARLRAGENDAVNPRLETNTASWVAVGAASIARDTSVYLVGAASLKVTSTGSGNYAAGNTGTTLSGATAGLVRTAAIYLYGTGVTVGRTYQVELYETGGATGTQFTVANGTIVAGWQRISVTRTIVQNDRTGLQVNAYVLAAAGAGETFNVTALQIVSGAVLQQYVDARMTHFDGFVENWPPSWPSHRRGIVTLSLIDALAVLGNAKMSGQLPEKPAGTRIGKALDAAGWPTADRAIDAGGWHMAAEALTDANVLGHCFDVADSDLGVVFQTGDRQVAFHDRDHRSQNIRSAAPVAIFGNGPPSSGELPVLDPQPAFDVQRTENLIKGSRPGGGDQSVTDDASRSRNWPRDASVSTKLANDDDLRDYLDRRLSRARNPLYEIRTITVDPSRLDVLWAVVHNLRISDRIEYRRRKTDAGTPKRWALYIEGYEHRVTLGATVDWQVVYSTSLAQP